MVFNNDSTVQNNGLNQLFLVKYSGSTGNVLWAKSIGADNQYDHAANCDDCESSFKLAYDSAANAVYMTGTLFGVTNFGSTVVMGQGIMFLTKIDLSGNFIWTQTVQALGMYRIFNQQILTDKPGNIYISGLGLDSMQFGAHKLPAGGYVAKYNSSGTCIWAQGQKNTGFTSMAIYDNDIYGLGDIKNDTVIIGGTSYTFTFSPSGISKTVFLARMDSTSHVKWIKFIPSTNYCSSSYLIHDAVSLYITGIFQTDITIGSSTFTNSPSNYDMFLAKVDTAGNIKWAQQANATSSVFPASMVNDASGNFYVSGNMRGTITFGSSSYTSTGLGYLARFDTSGACIGIIGGGGYIAEDNSGNFFVTNVFYNTLTINSNTYTAPTTSPPNSDVFIAKHGAMTTGIEGRMAKTTNNQLLIYANPTAGKCNITIPDDFLNEKNLTLQIFDTNGKVLQNTKVDMSNESIKLNLEAEAKGTYNVILSNGIKSYTGKIIFE